jgi:uncharacterized repeat protein (TIGR02543 family)
MIYLILLMAVEKRKGEDKMKVTSVLTLVLVLALIMATTLIMKPVSAQNPVIVSVEPVAIAPLTDTNASIYGLETPPTPSPVGQFFNVTIHVRNATVDHVPDGVGGVEVHFNFSNILAYAVPIGFNDLLGTPGGVLPIGPVLETITAGFYNATGSRSNPPYADAVQYDVAGASSVFGSPWNAADGLVCTIKFKITKQPQSGLGEANALFQLANSFTDLVDTLTNEISHDRVQGTLTIDATPQVQQNYTLTVNVVGSGSVAKNPDSATYLSGTNVTLTASAAVNWVFQGWSGDLTGSQNPVDITMNGNKTVTATFVAIQPGQEFTLTVNVVGSGSVTENPSNATYASGTVVTLTATPAVNWTFHLWSGDLTGAQNPINITMNANRTVTATFAKIGDFNNDGKVNLGDLMKFASWWRMNSTNPLWDVADPTWGAPSAADFDHNGKIELADLVTLAVYYSTSPH